MPKVDIEAAAAVCPSFNSLCTDQLGDLAGAKVFREVDNLVESKSTSAQGMEDDHASNMQKEGLNETGLVPCPSFTSYCCSDQVADIAVKVSGEFDKLTTLESKSEEDDDFTFDIPKWGHKFFFGPVFPVFNRDNILLEQFVSSQRDLQAMEEKSKSTTGTASPARTKLSELFELGGVL
ncbi:hypothetical protein ACLB2K_068193 [Fragaria x ananassa]